MATPGSSFAPTPLDHEDNLGVRNHINWGRIVFSDKSHFQLCPADNRRHVRRRPGQHVDPAFIIARDTGPQPRVIFWGAFLFAFRTSLEFIIVKSLDLSPVVHVWDMKGMRLPLLGNTDDLT
ncbi:transposable element Tc1 transposase [Trichonephila clavipes]|nr:transposable element Tc1 transposase [Trichonephila clavipes]